MLPLRQMPSADGDALEALYRQRARHGFIVCAETSRAAYPIHPGFRPQWGCLSVVAVRNGREEYHFPDQRRTISVDDDVYLVLDAMSRYSYRLESLRTARCLMVSFPPWMVAAARGVLTHESHELDAENDACPPEDGAGIDEELATHDEIVTPELRRLEQACCAPSVEPEWYLQQMGVLLMRVLVAERRHEARLARLSEVRRSTRRELVRRVARATDRIHQDYRSPLDLQTLSKAAGLSPFHFLRVFRRIHGITPQEFLQRKRVVVAKRLLATRRWSASQIAGRVGFQSRSSLYRWMRRDDGRALR